MRVLCSALYETTRMCTVFNKTKLIWGERGKASQHTCKSMVGDCPLPSPPLRVTTPEVEQEELGPEETVRLFLEDHMNKPILLLVGNQTAVS